MTRFAIRRRYSWFRSLWGGILLLGLVLQPLVAAIGEIHELGHGSSVSHAAFDAAQDASPPPSDQEERGESLHFLAHFTHCCSSAPGIPPATPAPLFLPDCSANLAQDFLTLPLRSALEDVLRPPIHA